MGWAPVADTGPVLARAGPPVVRLSRGAGVDPSAYRGGSAGGEGSAVASGPGAGWLSRQRVRLPPCLRVEVAAHAVAQSPRAAAS